MSVDIANLVTVRLAGALLDMAVYFDKRIEQRGDVPEKLLAAVPARGDR